MPTSNVGVPKVASLQNGAAAVINSNVKATPGRIKGIHISNLTASTALYVKIYDKASVAVPASDVSILTIPCAGSAFVNLADLDIRCSNGITVGASSGVADNDTGTITTAKTLKVVVTYK